MDPKLEKRQCVKCQDYFAIVKSHSQDICYCCGNPIIEHTPNCNTWTHIEFQDCYGVCRPIIPPNERTMTWQADETAEEYVKRIKHYYDGVIP